MEQCEHDHLIIQTLVIPVSGVWFHRGEYKKPVDVRRDSMSFEDNRNYCKQDNLMSQTQAMLIFDMYVHFGEYRKPMDFCSIPSPFEVNKGQKLKTV